ncbi:MAG: DUF58 domain-containing protein [Cyanobacteria bacterium J06649_4]
MINRIRFRKERVEQNLTREQSLESSRLELNSLELKSKGLNNRLRQLLKWSTQPSPLGLLLLHRLLKFNHRLKKWLTKHFTPTGLSVLGALFVFGLIGLDVKRSVSYQIFVFLFALLAVSIVLSRFIRYQVSVTRLLPRFGTVEVPLRYQVIVQNHRARRQSSLTVNESFYSAFPSLSDFRRIVRSKGSQRAWFKFIAQRGLAFSEAIALPPLPSTEKSIGQTAGQVIVDAEIIPLRRGLLPFNKLTLACPEPLGLVNRCKTIAQPQKVLILPKRYRLPKIELPGARRFQSNELASAAAVGDSEEFRSLREYRPGDSPRKIHWKSWAKIGKPIVKEEQEEYSVRHALILDTFQTERESEVLEEAIAIATSFIYTLTTESQTQDALLDTLFIGDQSHCFTLGRSLGQTEGILSLLASATACQDKPFDTLTTAVSTRLALLSGCICIFLDWDCDRKALIEQLQTANIPTLGLILAKGAEQTEGLTEPIDHSCLKNSQSSLHILPLDNLQEALLKL